ncbi:MAG: MFS transporter [Candidatus Peribacteraceae bacterium]|nr:MFS transporter [Candidatus Peribacteraceae bacterium]
MDDQASPPARPPHDARRDGQKRTVWLFGSASFLHDLGADMVFSVWPMFLSEVLGANKTIIGLIDGLGDATVSIIQALSGYLSDRWGKRKVFVWIGYLLGGTAKIGYALAPTWGWVIPFRLLDRSGKMRGSPRDAIISDLSSTHDRGRNFGILRMMDNSGAVVGIVLSIILLRFVFTDVAGLRTMFWLAAIPSVIATLLVIVAYRERVSIGRPLFKGIRFRNISPRLRLYFFLSAVFSLGSFSYSFLLLSARSLGFGLASMPLLYLLCTAVTAMLSYFFGNLSDRLGRRAVLLFSFGCWAAVSIIFLTAHTTAWIVLAFILYGVHNASLDPVQKALAAELAPAELVASMLGGYQMVIGLMMLPASLIAGMLWDGFGVKAPFLFSLLLTVVAAGLLLLLRDGNARGTDVNIS